MSEKCPKCGSDYIERDNAGTTNWIDVFRCGSEVDKHGEVTYESDNCLDRQLAAKDATIKELVGLLRDMAEDCLELEGFFCDGVVAWSLLTKENMNSAADAMGRVRRRRESIDAKLKELEADHEPNTPD